MGRKASRRGSRKKAAQPAATPRRVSPWLLASGVALAVAAAVALAVHLSRNGDAPEPRPSPPSSRASADPVKSHPSSESSAGPVTPSPASATSASPAKPPSKPADYKPLVGRWLRRDGGYVLDIRGVQPDGKLDAAYLNPRPINVSKAQASSEAGTLKVLVELRDRGYPGSYYTLAYNPRADRLVGVYHHLRIGKEFDITFVRLRPR